MVGPQTFAVEAFTPEVRGDVMSFGWLVAFRCARIPHFRQWCAPWLKPIDTLPRLLKRNLDPQNIPKRLSQFRYFGCLGKCNTRFNFHSFTSCFVGWLPILPSSWGRWKMGVSQCISNWISIRYTVYTFKYYAVVHWTMIMSEGVFGWLVFPRSCFQETMEIETMFLSYSDREGWMFRGCLFLWVCWCLTRWWFPTLIFTTVYLGKWSNLTNTCQMGWNHQLVRIC